MRRVLFYAVLLLSLPASATISQVQSNANFGNTAATCQVTFTTQNPTRFNMIAVWTSWTTSPPNNITVTSVKDQLNNGPTCDASGHCFYASAVGPTLQSASSTAGQIFYAVVRTGGSSDPVTVTFSSAPSSSNCVIVEYSGLDLNYPLDSVSAGYSTSGNPTSLLDSGTVAPANSNLLVFAGGTSDTTATVGAGSGFTSIQTHPGSITEQLITTIPNNTLQRATACLGATLPCPVSGNWVMQMAVFRDASSTVTGAWSPARTAQVRYADQFPGADCGAKITMAAADLGANPGEIWVNQNCGANWTTAVNLTAARQVLRLIQPGTYVTSQPITLSGNGDSIVGPSCPASISGGGPTCPVVIQEAINANLAALLTLSGSADTVENLTLDGNCNWTVTPSTTCMNNSTEGVGLLVTNLRGLAKHVMAWRFLSHGFEVQSTGSCSGHPCNQAAAFGMNDSMAVANGGDGLLIVDTADGSYHNVQLENNGLWGAEVYGGGGNRFYNGDFGQNGQLGSPMSAVGGWHCYGLDSPASHQPCLGSIVEGNQFGGNYGPNIQIDGWDAVNHGYGAFQNQFTGNYIIGTNAPTNTINAVNVNNSHGNVLSSTTIQKQATTPMVTYKNGIVISNATYGSGPNAVNDVSASTSAIQLNGSLVSWIVGTDTVATATQQGFAPIYSDVVFGGASLGIWWQDSAGIERKIMTEDGSNNIILQGHPTQQTIYLEPNPGTVMATLKNGMKLADQGLCTMASGTCTAQTLAATYGTAPLCFATWTGTGTLAGMIRIASTTTTVTPSSSTVSDSAKVNWICFGN